MASREIYEFDDFRLDPAHGRLVGPFGDTIALTAKPFDALLYLVEHAGEPLSRKALIEALWPGIVVEDNNLTQAISSLRGAIGKRYIIMLPRRGYQFVGDAHTVEPNARAAAPVGNDMPPQRPARESAGSDLPATVRPRTSTRWRRAAVTLGLLALVALGVGLWIADARAPDDQSAAIPNATAVP